MVPGRGEKYSPLAIPIKIQGMTIKPGEKVIALIDGQSVLRTYMKADLEAGRVWLDYGTDTSSILYHAGPWSINILRHPDILTGFIREVEG